MNSMSTRSLLPFILTRTDVDHSFIELLRPYVWDLQQCKQNVLPEHLVWVPSEDDVRHCPQGTFYSQKFRHKKFLVKRLKHDVASHPGHKCTPIKVDLDVGACFQNLSAIEILFIRSEAFQILQFSDCLEVWMCRVPGTYQYPNCDHKSKDLAIVYSLITKKRYSWNCLAHGIKKYEQETLPEICVTRTFSCEPAARLYFIKRQKVWSRSRWAETAPGRKYKTEKCWLSLPWRWSQRCRICLIKTL